MNSLNSLGLIETPRLSGARKAAMVVATLLFLSSLTLTGLGDWLAPMDLPKLKGDEKTRLAELRANSNWLDGSLARRIENDQRLRSPVRRRLVPAYGWFLYTQLSEAKGLYIGKDGWLFLPARARAPRDPVNTVGRAVNYLAALERMLMDRGTRLVVAPIPRKAVLLEEMLPHGVRPNRGVEEGLVRGLLACGLPTADLLRVFESADSLDMFFFADTHWSPAAEVLAAEEITRVAGIWQPPEERDTQLRPSGEFQAGFNLFAWLGADKSPAVGAYLKSHLHDKIEVYPRGSEEFLVRDNPDEACRIGLAGTSFVAHRAMRVLLRHFSGQEVWNAGQGGIGPIRPLRQYLQSLEGEAWPELMLLEFPVDQIIAEVGLSEVLRLCADWASPGEVIGPGWDAWEREPSSLSNDQGWRPLARLAAGRLAHSGDGTLSILLEREPADAGAVLEKKRLQLTIGEEPVEFFWERGERTLALPLVAASQDSGPLLLSIANAQQVSLKSIQIVHAHGLYPLAEAVPQAGEHPKTDLAFGFVDPKSVPSQGVLQVLGVRWSPGGRVELEMEFDPPAPNPRSFIFEVLMPGAPLVLGLQGWEGRRLLGLRIRSESALLGIPAAEVQLLGPAR